MRHAVTLDTAMVRKSKSGYESIDVLKDEALLIVRAGGVKPLEAYLDKLRNRNNDKLMGNYHPYNRVNLDQPQTRILFLAGNMGGVGSDDDDFDEFGYDCDYGMGDDASKAALDVTVIIAMGND